MLPEPELNVAQEEKKAELVKCMNEWIEDFGSVTVVTKNEHGNFHLYTFDMSHDTENGRCLLNAKPVGLITVKVAAAHIERTVRNGGEITSWTK